MYANTAYEALYEIMGLQFQEEVTRWITSQVIFRALILVIFGVAFFIFLLSLASRYIPFFLPSRRAPISNVILLVFCLFVGISLLKVDVTTGAANMAGTSWAQNPYVTSNAPSVRDQYRVSMIFRLLSGAAEETARALGLLIDSTFSRTHSQMQAPNFFYKAMLGAAFDTIDDPQVRSEVEFYASECLSKALPRFNPDTDSNFLDRYQKRRSIPSASWSSASSQAQGLPRAQCRSPSNGGVPMEPASGSMGVPGRSSKWGNSRRAFLGQPPSPAAKRVGDDSVYAAYEDPGGDLSFGHEKRHRWVRRSLQATAAREPHEWGRVPVHQSIA